MPWLCGRRRSTGAQRLSKDNRHATVKDSVRLVRPVIHRHPPTDEVISDFKEFDAQVGHCRLTMNLGQRFHGDRMLPDTGHGWSTTKWTMRQVSQDWSMRPLDLTVGRFVTPNVFSTALLRRQSWTHVAMAIRR